MKIVIKIGTQSILSECGMPLEPVLSSIVAQIVQLHNNGHQVVLVSSGAVVLGRNIARQVLGREYGSSIAEKQLLASLGQPDLIKIYTRLFKPHNILASQLLLTKQDFYTRKNYLNVLRLITEVLAQKNIIPIINENDSIAIQELMFTDNDELAGLIATQINADKFIILTNVEGVYKNYANPLNLELISIIDQKNNWPTLLTNVKSLHGRGGMSSKLATARKVSSVGITTHIASINQPLILIKLVMEHNQLGTTILPAKRKSNIKRWIAHTTSQGEIVINQYLYAILTEAKQAISILPIGIDGCMGDFKKGDIVTILDPDRNAVGIGMARYDAVKLTSLLGKKHSSVFIHYNYLHIF